MTTGFTWLAIPLCGCWAAPRLSRTGGASEGRGPAFIKLGSRVAYRGSDLNAWLATRSVRPTDGDGG